jgi:predicted enzyme related to lactoylglutathione lyase
VAPVVGIGSGDPGAAPSSWARRLGALPETPGQTSTLSVAPAAGTVPPMGRITGIGGVFFKSKSDHQQLAAWYARHLGLVLEEWGGAILKWPGDKAADRGITVWNVAEKNSEWFSPSASSFMINYRVDDLDELLTQLRRDGVAIVKGPESHENGRFAWILDPDGNKVELWQPMLWDEKNKQP